MFNRDGHLHCDWLDDFEGFEDYYDGWLKRNILEDLDTVLEGSRQRWKWKKYREPERRDGRGDFLLTPPLMTIFDHLGAFLAKENEALSTLENIGRVAREMPSLKDSHAVIATLGRNEFVHAAWQACPIQIFDDDPNFFFRLAFSAQSEEVDHRSFLADKSGTKTVLAAGCGVWVLKYILNLHVLRRELEDVLAVTVRDLVVSTDQYKRVVNWRTVLNIPKQKRTDKETQASKQVPKGKRVYEKIRVVEEQIKALHAHERAKKAYQNPGEEVPRD